MPRLGKLKMSWRRRRQTRPLNKRPAVRKNKRNLLPVSPIPCGWWCASDAEQELCAVKLLDWEVAQSVVTHEDVEQQMHAL
jgi:hypothetical protein